MALVTQSKGKLHGVATLDGRLVVGLWRRTPDLVSVKAFRAAGAAAGKLHPDGIFFLTVAENPGSPPDGSTRQEFASMMREMEGPTLASAITTIGGSNLGMSIVRGVVTGVLLLANHKTPTRMLANVGEAALWLGREAAARKVACPDAVAVGEAVTQLQRTMDAL